jgi:hypothetical protein
MGADGVLNSCFIGHCVFPQPSMPFWLSRLTRQALLMAKDAKTARMMGSGSAFSAVVI